MFSYRGIGVEILEDELRGLPDLDIFQDDLCDPLHLSGCGMMYQPPVCMIT